MTTRAENAPASSSPAAGSPPSDAPRRSRSAATTAPVRIVCAEDEPPYDRPPSRRGSSPANSTRYDARRSASASRLVRRQRRGADPRPPRRRPRPGGSPAGARRRLGARLRRPPDRHRGGGRARCRCSRASATRSPCARSTTPADSAPRLGRALTSRSSGAGFIGQEVASTARAQGADVTIVEALDLPLAHILGADVGRWLVDMHRAEGCRVLLSTQVSAASGNGRVERLELASGERDRLRRGRGRSRRGPGGRMARRDAASRPTASAPTAPAARPCRTSTRRGTSRGPGTTAWPITPGPSTGTPRPARGSPPRRRSSATNRGRRRSRASGATSTACGSSTSATRRAPTRYGSRASPATATSRPSITATTARWPPSRSAGPASSPRCGG